MKTNTDKLLADMTNEFLKWPLPESVCADGCAVTQGKGRIGTNLLSYTETLQMMKDVVNPQLLELLSIIESLQEVIFEHAKGNVTFHGSLVGEDIVKVKAERDDLLLACKELMKAGDSLSTLYQPAVIPQ